MPAIKIHPADSVENADTVVHDSIAAVPPVAVQDTALTAHKADTVAVVELPDAVPALPFSRSPLHDTPSMMLLIAGMLGVALSYHSGYKYIENFFHYMFSTRRRENLFEDHTVNETGIQVALIANTCITEGFLLYFAMSIMVPAMAPQLQGSVFPHIMGYCGIAAGFYIVQWLVYKVLGYTFTDNVGSKLWIDGFKASQSLLGLLLLPVLVLVMLYPGSGKLLLSLGAVLYMIARLIFIYKGYRIFYGNLSSILYFILYLCAVEIVPLVIMAGVTYWISGILQTF